MEVLTQVTGVDRVAKHHHPPQRNAVNPRGPSPARLQVQVTEGGQKRRGLRWQRKRHDLLTMHLKYPSRNAELYL